MRGLMCAVSFCQRSTFVFAVWLVPSMALAQATPANDSVPSSSDLPAFHLRFEATTDGKVLAERKDSSEKLLAPGRVVGAVTFDAAGPRPAKFPRFKTDNRAAKFSGGSSIRFADPGENSLFDVGLGDSITLEAWVAPANIGNGQNMYIVGKGRTKNEGVADENQNYALRLLGDSGQACVNFLFRNAKNRKGERDDFHRWTTNDGFKADGSWHHVAVTYTFGKGDSIKGYIDGKPLAGKWDYGGAISR